MGLSIMKYCDGISRKNFSLELSINLFYKHLVESKNFNDFWVNCCSFITGNIFSLPPKMHFIHEQMQRKKTFISHLYITSKKFWCISQKTTHSQNKLTNEIIYHYLNEH